MTKQSHVTLLTFAAIVAIALGFATTSEADDRRLITGFEEIPTVFFLFDTSGSMHWSSQCTQEDFDDGLCDYLCPTGSCWVPGNGDSPNSKLYQAKEAIYQVIDQTEGIHVGFATFNQDQLRLRRKHWLYEALEGGPNIPGYGPYPRPRDISGPDPIQGDTHVFGQSWGCTSGGGPDDVIGCAGATPANLALDWESTRVEMWPKETPDFNSGNDRSTQFFVFSAPDTWRVTFQARAAAPTNLGNPTIEIRVTRERCTDAPACASFDMIESEDVDFGLVSDFDFWDFNTARGPFQAGFFAQGTASDSPASNTCVSWDANDDTPADEFDGYNARFPTVADTGGFTPLLDVGDVLPIDWRNDNRETLLERLAPNLALAGQTVPDFRVATYFEDIIVPTEELHLKDEAARPIMAFGATPIGTSVQAFYNYVSGTGGWAEAAEANDPSFTCRQTYLIFLSDGNQSTCDTDDPCHVAGTEELFDELGLRTFVVAFGVTPHTPFLPRCLGNPDDDPNVNCCASDAEPLCIPSDSSTIPADEWPDLEADPTVDDPDRVNRSLRCMASTGGTGNEDYDLDGMIDSEDGPGVIYPQSQDELIDALNSILDQIKPAPTSFSTAAVPSVQAEAADKVFLSEFTPVPERSTWIGRVNAFLKPVPVDDQNRPDTSQICPADDLEDPTDDPSACLVWEAGDVILNNQINADPVGDLSSQRRIYYSEFGETVPRKRNFFEETVEGATPLAQEFDLWNGFNLPFDPVDTATHTTARNAANAIVDSTLSVKTTPVNDDFPVAIDYILNDIFHSDPLLLSSPNNLLYFLGDVDGYRDFSIQHAFRRRMLLFGSNGGLFHGLDAGVCRELTRDDPRPCLFDNGSGRELFGVMPRTAMPTVAALAAGPVRHRYGVDGRAQAADVFIDPLHAGANDPGDAPNADDREWRTVLLGGLREGGYRVPNDRGDLIHPEDINTLDGIDPANHFQSGYFALDLTQPDPLPTVPTGDSPIPDAVGINPPTCLRTLDGMTPIDPTCGPVAFSSVLWEFTDSIEHVRLDEDDNGHIDLAYAWSNANIGRIQVCVSGCLGVEPELEDRYVAIFGGGYDPDSPFLRGNHIYMLDMETGEAIYKRPVIGAIAAEPAAVDTNFDGYLDTIYFGTTFGLVYRINIGPISIGGSPVVYPEPVSVTVVETALDGTVVTHDVDRIINPIFGPFVILEASDPAEIPPVQRPIFFRPSVAFLANLNLYAVAVGTGNREDIFRRDQPSGRFFVFVDNVSPDAIQDLMFTPFSPVSSALTPLLPSDSTLGAADLLKPGEGWWLELADNERVITEPFALSGILFFSTFVPDPDGPEIIPESSLCRERGISNIYGVFTSNADGLLADDEDISNPDDLVRFITVEGLVSSPFTEQSQTKNPLPDDEDIDIIDDLSNRLEFIRDRLKTQFPANCTFPPGYRIDVKTRNSGTGIDFIAPVPICVVEKNFREF